ncbi:MAG: hypothetical protein WA130_01205 [Candidatus Methanoperedens sp.]
MSAADLRRDRLFHSDNDQACHKECDRLEVTSTLEKHNLMVNGRKHIPSIQGIER